MMPTESDDLVDNAIEAMAHHKVDELVLVDEVVGGWTKPEGE